MERAETGITQTINIQEDKALTVPIATGVLANDTDSNGQPLTAKIVAKPSHGTITLNTNGTFTYTPTTGYTGTDTFTYQTNDGTTNSNIATVTLNITDQAPVAINNTYNVNKNKPLTVPLATGVLANDTDPNGDSIIAILASTPSHGTISFNLNGTFTYIPTTGYVGTDTFTYEANDGYLSSNIATITLNIA